MQRLITLLLILVFTSCNTNTASHHETPAATPAQPSQTQKPSTDSPAEFLLTSAAADFHAHHPFPARFRNVRLGHFSGSAGTNQYMLCGEFLPQSREGKPEWTPFVTLRTSGYEQYLGAQAASFCQRPEVLWDKDKDLSSELQSRADSLH